MVGESAPSDLLLHHTTLVAKGDSLSVAEGVRVLDLTGCWVMPGWLDLLTRVGEPGYEHRETLHTAAKAAVAGGFTHIVAAPDTDPAPHTRDVVAYIHARSAQAPVTVHTLGCLTKARQGKELAEMAELAEEGVLGFSDGDRFVHHAGLMRRALEYARMLNLPVFVHPEDPDLAAAGMMHEGVAGTRAGVPGIPALAEEIALARDLELAAYTGTPIHVTHVTTARGVDLIRKAKASGVPVTASVSALHLVATDEDVQRSGYHPATKQRPPLRPKRDVEALRVAVADGTIDAILSAHRPYAVHETDVEFYAAPYGATGLELVWPLLNTMLVETGILSLETLAERLSNGPRMVLGLPLISLEVGAQVALTVVDPSSTGPITSKFFSSMSAHSHFVGASLRGRVRGIVGRAGWVGA